MHYCIPTTTQHQTLYHKQIIKASSHGTPHRTILTAQCNVKQFFHCISPLACGRLPEVQDDKRACCWYSMPTIATNRQQMEKRLNWQIIGLKQKILRGQTKLEITGGMVIHLQVVFSFLMFRRAVGQRPVRQAVEIGLNDNNCTTRNLSSQLVFNIVSHSDYTDDS